MRRGSMPIEGRCASSWFAGVLRMTSQHARNSARHSMQTGKRRRTALFAVPALLLALIPAAFVVSSASASVPSGYVEGVHVSPSLAGCRGSAGVSFPLLGPYVCPASEYTSDNLG